MSFRTQAPLPANLDVKLKRVASRPDEWAKGPLARDATSRPVYSIHLKRGTRQAGPFYWTGSVDVKHAQAVRDGSWEVARYGEPKGNLTPEEAMWSLSSDARCYLDSGPDLDGFAREFGSDPAKPSETVRAFEACRKVWETFALLGLDPHASCFQEA